MGCLELTNKGFNQMNFIIVSENKEKIKKILEGIFSIFVIDIDCEMSIEDEQKLINRFIEEEMLHSCVKDKFDIYIFLFKHLGEHMHGFRAPFIFIDKDMEAEITEDNFYNDIEPISGMFRHASIFNEGKGYFLI